MSAALGFGAGATIYYEISTCTTLWCLSGWFGYASWGVYDGIGLTVFWGNWNGYGIPTTFGADIGLNIAGAGADFEEGFSYTWVAKYTCGSNWNCKAAANFVRGVWDALTAPVRWLVNYIASWLGWARAAANWFIRHGF